MRKLFHQKDRTLSCKDGLPLGSSAKDSVIDYELESQQNDERVAIISVDRYREILADYVSTDKQIVKRLQYLEALCRNTIKNEIKSYAEGKKK